MHQINSCPIIIPHQLPCQCIEYQLFLDSTDFSLLLGKVYIFCQQHQYLNIQDHQTKVKRLIDQLYWKKSLTPEDEQSRINLFIQQLESVI